MNNLMKASLLAAALCPALALAVPVAGENEVTLSGAGSSDKDFNDTSFSIQGSWGKYLSEASLLGIRQTIGMRDTEEDSFKVNGSTRVFYDYHFGSGKARPFIGASIGGIYGDGVEDTFMAGPELGVKYWVLDKAFIQGIVEYQFLFKSGSEAKDRFDDGALFYSVGLGMNF